MTWQPVSTLPKYGEFLVYLKEPMINTRFHTMTCHPKCNVVGGRFHYDAPPVTHWMPLPGPPEDT